MSVLCSMVGASFTVAAVAQVLRSKKGITAVGNAQISTAQSQFGGASYLGDGNGDYLSVTNLSNFAFGTGDYTIEFWFRSNGAISSNVLLLDARPANSNGAYPAIYLPSSVPTYYVNSANRISGSTTLASNTWYHLAISRSGTSTRMFLNGTQEGSTWTDSTNFVEPPLWIIGAQSFTLGAASWNGYIDEFRVSNSARYTANFTPSTTPFVNDNNTVLLIHANGTNGSTFFEDDNGVRAQQAVTAIGDAKISTAQSQFGGTSALFDGTGDYLNLTNNSAYTFSGNFTIECWYRLPGAVPGIGAFFFNDHLFYLTNDGGVAKYAIFSGGTNRLLTGSIGTVSSGVWYHVAFVRNGSTLAAYHNGVSAGTATYSSTMTSQANNHIGFYPGSSFFNGHIDEYRISNTARYTANFTPSTAPFQNDANTVLLLHMDGTNNSTAFRDDNGARSQQGITAIGNAQISTAQSQFGGASALFDGNGDYLRIPNAGLNFSGDFTIEFWARHAAINDQQVYFDFRAGPTDHIIFYLTSGNKLEYYDNSTYTGTTNIAANTWYQIALSRSGSSLRLFINGTQEWIQTNGRSHTNSGLVWIGTSNDALAANSMNGHIDEFRVSNTARYTANFTPSTTPFQNDANTLLLIHADGTNGSTVFTDDNGQVPQTP